MSEDRLEAGRTCARQLRQRGHTDAEIAAALLAAGWSDADMDALLGQADSSSDAASRLAPVSPPASRPASVDWRRWAPWMVLAGYTLGLLAVRFWVPGPQGTAGSETAPPDSMAPGDVGRGLTEANAWSHPGQRLGQEIIGPAGIALVWVPGGSFMMGSSDADVDYAVRELGGDRAFLRCEQPAHRVELTGFWIAKTEVTVAQWGAIMGGVGPGRETDHHAIDQVTWYESMDFCDRLGLTLPTEAQWEYAARGPEGHRYPWGDEWDPDLLYWGQPRRPWPGKLAGSFPAGASWCGALDMAGSASEWCADWYAENYYSHSPERDAGGPPSGYQKVRRGGSCCDGANLCRSTARTRLDPTRRSSTIGFRVVSNCP